MKRAHDLTYAKDLAFNLHHMGLPDEILADFIRWWREGDDFFWRCEATLDLMQFGYARSDKERYG